MPSTPRFLPHSPASRRVWPLAVALLLAPLAVQAQEAPLPQDAAEATQSDPPSVVARISVLNGNVSLQPASVTDFTAASLNYPLTTGDRLYTDNGAAAELETGQVAVRLGAQTDLTVTAMTDQLEQFGLAQGSVHLRTFTLDQGTTLELDTPNAAVTVLGAGDVRVDVNPDSDTTVFTLLSGQAQVDAQGFEQALQPGEALQINGANPASAQDVERQPVDALDGFSIDRDTMSQGQLASESQYVDTDTIGADDLASSGTWENDSDEGAVWYPTLVAVGWQPYRNGRWTWIAPWGWTWIEAEPWGFAPFHYGRWAQFGNRWGWVPGPRPRPLPENARPPHSRHPIYSPALVAFVGGTQFSVGSAGVTAWFPLGPHEPYSPWYHASNRYLNRVNTTNTRIAISQAAAGQTSAGHASLTSSDIQNDAAPRTYINRPTATVAVPQTSFAAGRPVAASALRVPSQELMQAPVLQHPLVTPTREIVASTPARALPPQIARPVLEQSPQRNHNDTLNNETINGQISGQTTSVPARPTAPTHEGATRPLFNRAVPPLPGPAFEQQRQAIENTEPGRPLSPQQMNNVRENRPVVAPHFVPQFPHPVAPQPIRPALAPSTVKH